MKLQDENGIKWGLNPKHPTFMLYTPWRYTPFNTDKYEFALRVETGSQREYALSIRAEKVDEEPVWHVRLVDPEYKEPLGEAYFKSTGILDNNEAHEMCMWLSDAVKYQQDSYYKQVLSMLVNGEV